MSVQLPTIKQKVYIVPLISLSKDRFYFQTELNKIYKQAGIELSIVNDEFEKYDKQ
jgi:hypothetical protein